MKIVRSIVAFSTLLLFLQGCSLLHPISQEESMAFTKTEAAYLDRLIALQEKNMEPKPLVTFQNPADPKSTVTIYQQSQPIDFSRVPQLQQKRPSEWAPVLSNFVSAAAMVGGIYVGGMALDNIVDSVGKNAGHNVMNSNNKTIDGSTVNMGAGQLGNSVPISGSFNQANPTGSYNQENPTGSYNQANQANPSSIDSHDQANPSSIDSHNQANPSTIDSHNQANSTPTNSYNPTTY